MLKTLFILLSLVVAVGARAQELKHENCNTAGTQEEINWCVGNNYRIAEAVLDSVYRAFVAEVGYRLQNGLPDTTEPIIGAKKALIQSQKAWLEYRDHAASLIEAFFGHGSIGDAEAWTYKTKLTLDGIRELELLKSFWNGTKPNAINPDWRVK